MNLSAGQKFENVEVEEFQRINKEANAVGLMAHVLSLDRRDDGNRVSFEIITAR
jgi:hypothetical protein